MFLFSAIPALAEDTEKEISNADLMNYVGYGAIVVTLLLIVFALLVVLRAMKTLAKIAIGAKVYKQMLADEAAEKAARKLAKQKDKGSLALKLLSLKPMSEEASITIDHEYDGIRELNNPTPAWFMYLFYATMVFAVAYLLIYHVFGTGQLQYEEYRTEVALADKAKAAWLAKAANRVDENTVKLETDGAVIAAGKAIFTERCAACHGDHAQGMVGPNLTDDYWLHGNKINEIFKTVKYGVAAKGMPTWEKQLSPKQIADVANYVKSLHGSNPANPKEPQGEKITDEAPVKAGSKVAVVAVSK